MLTDTTKSKNAKVTPVASSAVSWMGGLWKEAADTCARSTVPKLQDMFESKDISHVVENFKICAGDASGKFGGTVFGDGDFYKWMEAAIYSAVKTDNKELLAKVDYYIDLIGRAQKSDGYISTKQIIGEMQKNGVSRMGDINDFEVYNFGHLFTAACLHKRLTGKDTFMAIAKKTADYLGNLYSEAKQKGEIQTAVCPSHYMGLVEMYRTTKDKGYLELAKEAIRLRDLVTNGMDDNQDKTPLLQHEKIIGHAVRANYLYAGVADLCLEEDAPEYREVLDKVWRNLVDKKLYITGGCGALYNGASPYGNFFHHQLTHQAYGYEYQLPNITAYNETCAAIGGIMWAYRMFQLDPKAEYFDILERMMLNTNLAAVSLDGKRFFYENMLRRAKKLDYEMVWPLTRSEYILSYCCPPNLARTIAESTEYAYLTSKDSVWVGLYGASKADIRLENGSQIKIVQKTDYPYDGKVDFSFSGKTDEGFTLRLRIPGWAKEGYIMLNGEKRDLKKEESSSYISIEIKNPDTDRVTLYLNMKARYTVANAMVEEDTNQAAIEYGPLVYCAESADTDLLALDDIFLNINAEYQQVETEICGRKIIALEAREYVMNRGEYDRDALYQTLAFHGMREKKIRFIPYFAWDNRDYGEMKIWFPIAYR